ncbi:hypothetical protein NBRC10513v2_005155 [Rhodotorula toruloides]|uniref:Uncharacterized protein n=1 Tax=Rhodotorula toruloides TaxID=5286 RepID=A0A0K3C8V5_RHOTO|nr:hypothetical protein AAT19DRAFT_9223 [Rhodotorula toruloides]
MASLPPPPKHPSSRALPRPDPSHIAGQHHPPVTGQEVGAGATGDDGKIEADGLLGATTLETPVIAVTRPESPSTPPLPVDDRPQTPDAITSAPPPPRHPLTARSIDPEPAVSPDTPLEPPPLRRETTAADAKLAEVEDLEIQDLLQRVGDYLTDVKVAGLDAETVEYPEVEVYRKEGGALDWIGYGVAYISCFVHNHFPAGLVGPPPPDSFSFRYLQGDLERLYVLCPPPVLQRLLLGSLGKIWRWENPRRTGTWAAIYLFLWFHDLILFFPFAFFLYHLLSVRFFPPTTDDLIRRIQERRNRAKDATELGNQLKASSVFGMAGQGVKGLWADVRGRFGREEEEEEERSIAAGLGAGLMLGGMAASSGMSSSSSNPIERVRSRSRSSSSASLPTTASSTPPANSALARGLGASAAVFSAPSAPTATQIPDLQPPPSSRIDVNDPDYDPARAKGGKEGDGNVSLYRLVRNLTTLVGPQVLVWTVEAADLSEMVKNLILHPSHPSTVPIILRFSAICVTLLFTPTWLLYKFLWLWLGIEVFILWRIRELYPSWRRATLPYWLLLHGAPTDVEYALWSLKGRSRPLKGSKTIKRAGRDVGKDGRLRTLSDAVKKGGKKALSRSGSETSLVTLGKEEEVLGSFFALYDSKPGTLRLTSSAIHFIPSVRLRRFGKLASRISRRSKSSSDSDDAADTVSIASSMTADTVSMSEGRIVILVDEVASVKKETRMMALDGLLVATKDGRSWRFSSVARRDDAFNKILSLSSANWQPI